MFVYFVTPNYKVSAPNSGRQSCFKLTKSDPHDAARWFEFNAPDFYSWGFRFDYRPAHRLSWYSSHPPGRCYNSALNLTTIFPVGFAFVICWVSLNERKMGEVKPPLHMQVSWDSREKRIFCKAGSRSPSQKFISFYGTQSFTRSHHWLLFCILCLSTPPL